MRTFVSHLLVGEPNGVVVPAVGPSLAVAEAHEVALRGAAGLFSAGFVKWEIGKREGYGDANTCHSLY